MSSHGSMATTSQTRQYQGFPYTNVTVIDVPTTDRSDYEQWAHLPRRPYSMPKAIDSPRIPENAVEEFVKDTIFYNQFEDRRVAIASETQKQISRQPKNVAEVESSKEIDDEIPQIYIHSEHQDTIRYPGHPSHIERPNAATGKEENYPSPRNSKDEVPKIYIQHEPTRGRPSIDSDEEIPRIYIRPEPQDNVDLAGSSSQRPNLQIPAFMSKESSIYRPGSVDDSFSLSPLPVTEFPDPPPAYSEIDQRVPRVSRAESQATQETELPRVIVTGRNVEPSRTLHEDRQHVKCPHCDRQVYTVVIREAGLGTHCLAWLCFFIIFPITILIYCSDHFKYKNHYCPECGKQIGYENPFYCYDFVFVG